MCYVTCSFMKWKELKISELEKPKQVSKEYCCSKRGARIGVDLVGKYELGQILEGKLRRKIRGTILLVTGSCFN